MLDCGLYGLNAGGHHVTNVVLHTIAALLLFHVLRQMTGAWWKSAIVAALFAVHPLHVESVAWVSERKDVLSAVFFFLMLDAYVRYARAATITRYLVVTALFVAGLMSKPMLVTAPIVLLILDYWPLRRFERIASTTGESEDFAVRLSKAYNTTALSGKNSLAYPFRRRRCRHICVAKARCWFASSIAISLAGRECRYELRHLRLENIVADAPRRFLSSSKRYFGNLAGYSQRSLFCSPVTCAAIVWRDKRPYLFTGWFWYFVMLVPVIGIVQVGEQGHADRYTYLPSIGLFLMAVWAAGDVAAMDQVRLWRGVATAVTIVIVAALGCTAFAQTSYWRNSETLWEHALAVTTNNDVAHNNLGYLSVDRGELDKAMSHFEAASKIRSDKLDPHYNLGTAFVEMNIGDALARKGQPDEAMAHFEQAIKLQPDYAEAYYNRGNVLYAKGRMNEAIADFEKALQMQPNDADAHTGLGNALLRKGALKEAIAHYSQAMALAPE